MFAARAACHDELSRAGVLRDAADLQPSRIGCRIAYCASGGNHVVDGLFARPEQLVEARQLFEMGENLAPLEV